MLSRREKYLLALLPPLAIVCVQAFFEPRVEQRIAAAEARLGAKRGAQNAAPPPVGAASIAELQRQIMELEEAAATAEQRAPALRAKWTHPERRAQVVSDLARLFEARGARLRSSSSAPASEVPDVPALEELERSMHALGGAAPEPWRFELSGGFEQMLDVLGALGDSSAFVLPLTLQAKPHPGGGRDVVLDVVLWAWI